MAERITGPEAILELVCPNVVWADQGRIQRAGMPLNMGWTLVANSSPQFEIWQCFSSDVFNEMRGMENAANSLGAQWMALIHYEGT